MKKLIYLLVLFIISSVYSQNITNTLGNTGTFTIKDAANTYLTLTQSSGNLSLNRGLNLPFTISSTTGIIFKNSNRFIHDFAPVTAQGHNTFVGLNSGNFTMSGSGLNSSFNTGVGSSSLLTLTTGAFNTALGYFSLNKTTSGSYNTAVGTECLYSNITGGSNSGFGHQTLSMSTGGSNSAFGYQSLTDNTTGDNNSSFGAMSMWLNTSGTNNCSFGYQSMFSNNTAGNNSAFGYQCLFNNNGTNNNCFGYQSMYFNTGGVLNCAFGTQSLYNNSNGTNNAAFGNNTLINNTTGIRNTAFGDDAGSTVINGNNLTLIGYNSEPTSSSATNQVTLGNASVTSLRCAVTTITSLSDARDKKNIRDLTLGLDFIARLKPRLFNWDKREWYENNNSDGSKMQEAPTAGFIAQELDEAQNDGNAEWLNLVLKDNPEKWEATPGNLLPVMIKAIQELNAKCDSLQDENQKLTASLNEINDLKSKLAQLSEQLFQLTNKTGDTNTKNNTILVTSDENSK